MQFIYLAIVNNIFSISIIGFYLLIPIKKIKILQYHSIIIKNEYLQLNI